MEYTSTVETSQQSKADNTNNLADQHFFVRLSKDVKYVEIIDSNTQQTVQLCCKCSEMVKQLQNTKIDDNKENGAFFNIDMEAKKRYHIGEIEIPIAEADFLRNVEMIKRMKDRKRKNFQLDDGLDDDEAHTDDEGWFSKQNAAKRRPSCKDVGETLNKSGESTESEDNNSADSIFSTKPKKKLTREEYKKDLEMRRLLKQANKILTDIPNCESCSSPELHDELDENNITNKRTSTENRNKMMKSQFRNDSVTRSMSKESDKIGLDTSNGRAEETHQEELDNNEIITVYTPKRVGTSRGKVITSDSSNDENVEMKDDDERLSTDGFDVLALNKPGTSKSSLKKQQKNNYPRQLAKKQHKPKQKKTNKQKQRKRIVRLLDTEDELEADEDLQKEVLSDEEDKHQKRRRIIPKKKLAEQTREAEKAEKERRKRLEERQREFNGIELTTDETTGETVFACPEIQNHIILKSIVLDPDSQSETPCPVKVHPSLVRVLKKHQAEGIKFLYECTIESLSRLDSGGGGGILGHCMGLGKTLQVIAFLHTILTHPIIATKIRKVLVVVPKNVVINWRKEFERWLFQNDPETDQFNYIDLEECRNNDQRLEGIKYWIENERPSVLIIGYEMYRNLTLLDEDKPPQPLKAKKNDKNKKKLTKSQKYLEKLKVKFREFLHNGPDMIICDEGHKLKSPATGISCTMNKIKTKRRICLTGTPIQNNLEEYYCMVDFVKPNLLGTMKEFQSRFSSHIKRGRTRDATPSEVNYMRRRCHVLFERLKGILDRRDVHILRESLPPKQEYVINVRLTQPQIDLYRKYLEICSKGDTARAIFDDNKGEWRSTKGMRLIYDHIVLQRIWTHPYLLLEHERDLEQKRLLQEDEDFIVPDEENGEATTSEHLSDAEGDKFNAVVSTDNNIVFDPLISSTSSTSNLNQNINMHKSGHKQNGQSNENDLLPNTPPEFKDWASEHCSEDDRDKFQLSNKLVLLMDIIKKCEAIGDKLLVFSQFLGSIALIERMLAYMDKNNQWFVDGHEALMAQGEKWSWEKGLDYEVIDGSVSSKGRDSIQTAFNDIFNLRTRLLLISTRAGSLGTNLVGANRVVIFDCCWNPSHDTQSLFRVYRYGQTKPVYIYRFIAQGTMEERIYRKGVTKESIAKRVTESAQIQRHYTNEELEEMYQFDPASPIDQSQTSPVLDPPKDRLLGDIILKGTDAIVDYHPHDILFDELEDEKLTDEERDEAWRDYEREQQPHIPPPPKTAPPPLESTTTSIVGTTIGQVFTNIVNNIMAATAPLPHHIQTIMGMTSQQQQQALQTAQPMPTTIAQQQSTSVNVATSDHSYYSLKPTNSFESPQKTLELHRQRFDTEINALFQLYNDDNIFKHSLKIKEMTHKTAIKLFQIKQFLCYFIYQLPEEKRGLISNSDKFNELFMEIMQRAIELGENASWVKEKVYIVLNSTISFVKDVPECVMGISFITNLFPEAFENKR